MYFASRVQAGRMLATKLLPKYRYENCTVLAIDDGGVVLGAQIAMQLHCVLNLLSSTEIKLPMEPLAIAGITTDGSFSYNNSQYNKGELEELVSENRGFIEQEKLSKLHELNHMTGSTGTTSRDMLNGHDIIIVSDGLKSSFEVDLVYEFLKPIKVNKLIFAVALASVSVVDKMHVIGDDLYCLDVLADYMDTNHYYDDNNIPDHDKIIKIIQNIILNWK
jgi:predicted phosphoribosyltransferase